MAASAFIVCIPEAEPHVAHWRQRLDPSAGLGVPAHITVLHPFMPAQQIGPAVLEQISAFAAAVEPFSFSLSGIRRFPGVLCLNPDPAAAFVALTKGLIARFPDFPPYDGQHDDIIPHLTVARSGEDELDSIEAQLRAALDSSPVAATCSELVLIENSSGRWNVMHRFSLGAARRGKLAGHRPALADPRSDRGQHMNPMQDVEWSFDNSRLDIGAIHAFLSGSYWSPGIPRAVVERAIENSLCIGGYIGAEQVAFARMITDRATFAYLADVFVAPAHRGKGLSRRLMAQLLQHPDLQGLRRMMLATRDAHGLYLPFGFKPLAAPGRFMEKHAPHVYQTDPPEPG